MKIEGCHSACRFQVNIIHDVRAAFKEVEKKLAGGDGMGYRKKGTNGNRSALINIQTDYTLMSVFVGDVITCSIG